MPIAAQSVRIAASVVAGLLGGTLLGGPALAQSRTFYVDADGGSDSADGRSPATAWKFGPWDVRSAGAARRLALLPGDTVLFKGGVRYRGTMTPRGAGTVEKPIVFDGSGWGGTRAIMDGSQELSGVRRCTSAADCFGNIHWSNLWRVAVPATTLWTDWLFVNDQALQPAQSPSLAAEDADNIDKFFTVPRTALAQLQAGSISRTLNPDMQKGTPVLGLWVQPNVIAYTSDVKVTTAGLSFAGADWINGGLKPYTNRDSKWTLINVPSALNRPGQFAISPKDGMAIFWPPAGSTGTPRVSTGSGRIAFNVGSLDNFVLRGFSFANFAATPDHYASGTAILSNSAVSGATIADNAFRAIVNLGNGMAAIHLVGASNSRLLRNHMTQLPATSAMIIDNSPGPVTVQCNVISNIGRTGIRFLNVKDGTIRGNRLSGINGVHGNAITAYNDIRNGVIADNVVTNSLRPLTVKGGGATEYFDSGVRGIRISNNIFITPSLNNSAVSSWGSTPNMQLVGNFLSGAKSSLNLAGNEPGFVATGNQMVGSVILPRGSTLFDAAANTMHAVDSNGILLTDEKSRQDVASSVCG